MSSLPISSSAPTFKEFGSLLKIAVYPSFQEKGEPLSETINRMLVQLFEPIKTPRSFEEKCLLRATIRDVASSVSLSSLIEILEKNGCDPKQLLSELEPWKPLKPDETSHQRLSKEWFKVRSKIAMILPRLLDLFLQVFDILDPYRFGTKSWEKAQIFEMLVKLILLPYLLMTLLSPYLTVSLSSYALSLIIICATGALLGAYNRYLRPPPPNIAGSIDLDFEAKMSNLPKVMNCDEEIERLISAFKMNHHVLIVAPPGYGKTSLVHRFANLKQRADFPLQLKTRKLYAIGSHALVAGGMSSQFDLLSQIKEQTKGYEDDFILFLDEFNQVVGNEGNWNAFRTAFLTGSDKVPLLITALTESEHQAFKEKEEYRTFEGRFEEIILEKPSEEKVKNIIDNWVSEYAYIPFSKGARESFYDKYRNDSSLRKMKMEFETRVGKVAAFYESKSKRQKEIYEDHLKMYLIYKCYVETVEPIEVKF